MLMYEGTIAASDIPVISLLTLVISFSDYGLEYTPDDADSLWWYYRHSSRAHRYDMLLPQSMLLKMVTRKSGEHDKEPGREPNRLRSRVNLAPKAA